MTHNWRSYWVYEAVLLLFLLFRLLTHYWNLETVLGVLRTPSSPVLSHGWMCSGDTSVRTEVLGVQGIRGGSLICYQALSLDAIPGINAWRHVPGQARLRLLLRWSAHSRQNRGGCLFSVRQCACDPTVQPNSILYVPSHITHLDQVVAMLQGRSPGRGTS